MCVLIVWLSQPVSRWHPGDIVIYMTDKCWVSLKRGEALHHSRSSFASESSEPLRWMPQLILLKPDTRKFGRLQTDWEQNKACISEELWIMSLKMNWALECTYICLSVNNSSRGSPPREAVLSKEASISGVFCVGGAAKVSSWNSSLCVCGREAGREGGRTVIDFSLSLSDTPLKDCLIAQTGLYGSGWTCADSGLYLRLIQWSLC